MFIQGLLIKLMVVVLIGKEVLCVSTIYGL
jgi:hypothetical protein